MEEFLKNKKLLNELGIEIIPEDRHYWFLRTQNGDYYDDFINEGFVGIEWDKVSNLNEIKKSNKDSLKIKVEKNYPNAERPGYIASQILRFCNDIKKGHIVLVPSESSKWISFGEILDDEVFINDDEDSFEDILDKTYSDDSEDQEYTKLKKRRNVKWLKHIKRSELDPYLYSIIYSHNTIVDLSKYSIFIDRTLSQFYIKGEEAYFTYKINKKQNIPYSDMLDFLNNNNKFIKYLNNNTDLDINENDIILKINVQSKGPVQFKGAVLKILGFGLGISLLCGSKFDVNALGVKFSIETEGLPKLITTISNVINDNDTEVAKIKADLNESKEKLEIDVPKIKDKSEK